MTFIQPNKNNSLFRAFLIFIVIGLVGGTFWLIALYNSTVAMQHEIAAAKVQLDAIGAENTALNNQVVTTLGDTGRLSALAAEEGLVMNSKPQYLSVAQ